MWFYRPKRTKLQKVVERQVFKSQFDIDHFLNTDSNISYYRAFHVKQGDTIYWIEGYGERTHFFMKSIEEWSRRTKRVLVRYRLVK